MKHVNALSVILLFLVSGCQAYQWTSSGILPDGATINVCSGENVTLAWAFTVDPTEQTMNTQWYFRPKDMLSRANGDDSKDRTLIATQTAGLFLRAPTAHQHLVYMPNAGLELIGVSSEDSGSYSVYVNLNVNGDAIAAMQHVILNVSDTNCVDMNLEIASLTDEISRLEEENQSMKSRAEKLLTYPPFADAVHRPSSCVDVQKYAPDNGVHTLYMSDGTPITVYCDQSTTGGWAVFQRRMDGTTDFFRGWQNYEDGFGFVEGDFWIGLWNLYLLTKEAPSTLRIELVSFDDRMHYIEYDQFSIGNRSLQYKLGTAVFSHGTLANNLMLYGNHEFSTFDRTNGYNCPVSRHGAWWYANDNEGCTHVNLNGPYLYTQTNNEASIIWQKYQNNFKRAEMKLKPT